ncbi:molybdate ABC transporter substrate-binding protein [Endozoicomonadaceae bacterium StTr2]
MIKRLLLACLAMSLVWPAAADTRIAVAANFRATAEKLAAAFQKKTGEEVSISSASTGALYNQILFGAPYDLFLSADAARPEMLIQKQLAQSASCKTYAYGRLVLWRRDEPIKGLDDLRKITGKIAVPDPVLAPYGAAASEALQYARLWSAIEPELVKGSSVQQAWQFVASGNAKAGFVAWSQLVDKVKPDQVYFVPTDYYQPLEQKMVLLSQSKQPEVATRFAEYLCSEEGQNLIRSMGYKPGVENAAGLDNP